MLDENKKDIIDLTWDRFPTGQWSELQEIPDDLQIIGLKVINSDDDEYVRGLSFILGPSNAEELKYIAGGLALSLSLFPLFTLILN